VNWTKLRRMAISLPLAILAACLMIGINEYGYKQTNQSLTNLTHAYDTRNAVSSLMKEMLDAETGLRGFLLTGDENYLQPYNDAIKSITQSQDRIRTLLHSSPKSMELFVPLSRSISRKTACYACLFSPEENFEEVQCSTMGVFAPLVGIIGCMQAAEALKLIAQVGESLAGKLLMLDGKNMEWSRMRTSRNPECTVCCNQK